MAFRFEYRLGIQATSDRIWEILSDLSTWHGWNPIYPEASGKIVIGATIELLEKLPNLPERRVTCRLTDWTPREQLLLFKTEGFMTKRLQYLEIDELAPGNCIFSGGVIFQGWSARSVSRKYGRSFKLGYGLLGEALKAKAEGQ